ncbi:ArnT family glycosyltransferase [Desulfatirhabdium butyrativorans]|uniref:ArnT family glycosyltransferase n=1 Tax=Desulfatirhabdium butyrativorans TaxID=340467 RepID=UPI0004223B58|nr:glycosyltransferase family 39 protein [Desulfatirhabdium butyrativorans]
MTMMEMIREHKRILLFLFVAAFALRAAYLILMAVVFDYRILARDYEYGVIANSLIAGKGYSVPLAEFVENEGAIHNLDHYRPTAYHLPFYPMMLAAVYGLSESPLSKHIVMWIQAVVGSFTCLILYLVAYELYRDKWTALIAGIIMTVYPTFIVHVSSLVPETLLLFWFSLSMLGLLVLRNDGGWGNAILTGIFLGVSILTSNVLVPIIPSLLIWLFVSMNGTAKTKSFRIMALVFTMSFVIAPLLVRNFIVFDMFPLLKSTAGTNLWLGNNPLATGTFYLQNGEKASTILPKAFVEAQCLSETEQDHILYEQAMRYIQNNPIRFIKLFLIKLYYFLWFPPDHLLSREAGILKKISMAPYILLLAGCMIGIYMAIGKYPKETFLLCAVILTVALLYSVFIVGHPRYRMTIEPYMIILLSYAVKAWIAKTSLFKQRRSS